jgi:hypothetical protein
MWTYQIPLSTSMAALAHRLGRHDPATPKAPGTTTAAAAHPHHAATTICQGPRHGPSTGTSIEYPTLRQRVDTVSLHFKAAIQILLDLYVHYQTLPMQNKLFAAPLHAQ